MNTGEAKRLRIERMAYTRDALLQLRSMTSGEGCDFLTLLIDMAVQEASDVLRGARPYNVTGGRSLHTVDTYLQAASTTRSRAAASSS